MCLASRMGDITNDTSEIQTDKDEDPVSDQEIHAERSETDHGMTANRRKEIDARNELVGKLQMPTEIQQMVAMLREDDCLGACMGNDATFSNQVLRCTTVSEDEAEDQYDLS